MPNIDAYRVMSFDCYGTMIDWETGILGQLRPWAEARGARLSDTDILRAFGRAEADLEAATPGALYPEVLRGVHLRLAAEWGLVPDEEAADRFAASVGDWPAFPDSRDALNRLRKRYRLVVLSNVDGASFAASSRRLGVEFDAVYTAEDIGSYKPDPRNFVHLLESEEAAGCSREELLHVGQSLYHDHVPAARAGLATCWIRRPSPAGAFGATRPPEQSPDVDFHFESLADLADAAGV